MFLSRTRRTNQPTLDPQATYEQTNQSYQLRRGLSAVMLHASVAVGRVAHVLCLVHTHLRVRSRAHVEGVTSRAHVKGVTSRAHVEGVTSRANVSASRQQRMPEAKGRSRHGDRGGHATDGGTFTPWRQSR
eukprot:359289-Chlamydomonas_euryale.AAC.1